MLPPCMLCRPIRRSTIYSVRKRLGNIAYRIAYVHIVRINTFALSPQPEQINTMTHSNRTTFTIDSSDSEQLSLDIATLQAASESIAALFPACFLDASSPCECYRCRSRRSASAAAASGPAAALPPPSRYMRRAQYASHPPNGPAFAKDVSNPSGAECYICPGKA